MKKKKERRKGVQGFEHLHRKRRLRVESKEGRDEEEEGESTGDVTS